MDRSSECAGKLEALRNWLEKAGRDAVLLASQSNFSWVTAGGHSHVSIGSAEGAASVLVTRTSAFVLSTNIEIPRLLAEETKGLPMEGVAVPWHEPEEMQAAVRNRCDLAASVSDLGVLGLPTAGADLAPLRYTLQPSERDRYRALGADAAEAVEAALLQARPGDAESDVAGALGRECGRRGILPLVLLVAADERIAAFRHPLPTDNRVEHTLLVALTGRRHGLHASLTRMVSFGSPDAELSRRHAAVLRVDARYDLASRPGASLADVLAAGADAYDDFGFPGEWHRHHQGGLTGYAGRELFATPQAAHRLEAGQAVAWNPSITRVKSEDTVLVTADGPEVLTRTASWPQTRVELGDGALERPALLVRGTRTS